MEEVQGSSPCSSTSSDQDLCSSSAGGRKANAAQSPVQLAQTRSQLNVAVRSFNPHSRSFGEWVSAQMYMTWDHPQSLLVEFADGTTAVWAMDCWIYEIAIGPLAQARAL